jgi:hypothetical protein
LLKNFLKNDKGKLFLGNIVVVPRSDLKRSLDEIGLSGNEKLDLSLHSRLEKVFELPLAKDAESLGKNDLGLDIIVPRYQSGDAWEVSLGVINFPILLIWRPKIKMTSRLFYLESGKTVYTTSVSAKLPWREYLSRLFTFRAFFRFKPMFDAKDMDMLLIRACVELLSKLKKFV